MSTTTTLNDDAAIADRIAGVPAPAIFRDIATDVVQPRRSVKLRHGRLISLCLTIMLPTALMATYLYGFAADQYVTEFRFSVRHQAPLKMDVTAGSLAAEIPTGAAAALAVINESEMVVQYLKSTQVIDDITAAGVDLNAVYSGSRPDFWTRLSPAASLEERQRYWRRMVDPFFDLTNGIVSVEVNAFRPADSRLVAAKTLALCEKLMNEISNRARADTLAFAEKQVQEAETTMKAAQAASAAYRNKHAVLFPEQQATGDTMVEGTVRQSLIEAKAAYTTQIAQGVSKDAMQMGMLRNRIAALDSELQALHGRLANADPGAGASLASVLSEYSALQVAEQTAAKIYERALTLLLDSRNEASQQSIYLATFVHPGLPEDSLYPVRWRITLEAALISFVAWCLTQLIYHGVRDHIH
jgi:capsular polysaccharide transport system permease protein